MPQTKLHKAKNPKPIRSKTKCARRGCKNKAIGDEFCSSKCCMIVYGVKLSGVGYTGGAI